LDRLRRKRKKKLVFGFSEENNLVSSKLFYRFPAIQAIKILRKTTTHSDEPIYQRGEKMDIPAASRARQQLVVCDAGTRQKSGKFQSWPCCLLTLLQFISFNYPNPKKKNTQKNQEKKQLKNSDSSPQKLSDLTRLLASKISDRKIPRLFSSLHLLLPKRREREREREMGCAHDCKNLGFCLPAP
jgi:hypothetical protein